MALPIWGIFMKKVISDGTLGVTKYDMFQAPQGFSADLNCDGSDQDMNKESETESFFDM